MKLPKMKAVPRQAGAWAIIAEFKNGPSTYWTPILYTESQFNSKIDNEALAKLIVERLRGE